MGKQTRRRNRKKGGSSNQNKGNNTNNSIANTSTTTTITGTGTGTGSTSLINKIRHGEVRVRHAALSALSSTIFSPESLSKTKDIKMELIQAMSERIMDDDVPCALCAVGCIANYILFQESTNSSKNNDDQQSQSATEAARLETILAPILLTRMNKACDQIESIYKQMVTLASTSTTSVTTEEGGKSNDDITPSSTTTNASGQQQQKNKKKKQGSQKKTVTTPSNRLQKLTRMIMEQFSIISLSLHAFCGLVEIFATNNTSSSLLHHQRDQFLSTTMRTFKISGEMIVSLATAASNSSTENPTTMVHKFIAKNENEANIISDVAVYSARTIHSSSDDNPEFIKAILASNDSWGAITSSISNTSLPTLSRLHNAGTIIVTRHCVMDSLSSSSTPDVSTLKLLSDLDTIFTTQIFPLLSQCTMYSTDIASALCQQIVVMESKMKEEATDEEMEKNIIKMVDKKKESARLIAKRQKEMKAAAVAAKAEKKKMEIEQDQEQDDAMEGDELDDKKDLGDDDIDSNEKTSPTEETEDKYDKAVNAWKNSCLPLKLAVEVIANLCASRTSEEQSEKFDEADDEMGWDSDQEERLLASGNTELPKQKQEDVELFSKIISCGIPDRVLSVFGCILLSLIGSKKDQISKVALEDMFEVLTKCEMCLGNIVCNLDGWKSNDTELAAVWKEFFQCLTAAMDGETNMSNIKLPCQAISALFSTMVAFLRFRPSLVKCVDEKDLGLILSYVLLEAPPVSHLDPEELEAISNIKKDAIGLLGILSSEPHPDEINQQICTVFLTVLSRNQSTSAALMNELLNALMDMYSADEGDPNNHESIFKKNDVLGVFEKSIPILKRKIREESNPDPMDTVVWKETALNASRFVKYKKG